MDIGEVESWIDSNWSTAATLREWWSALFEAGLAFPTWPQGLGGLGFSAAESRLVSDALAAAGAAGPPSGVGQHLGAPTLLVHGTAEQRWAWVPVLARGEESWCQLFSEPDAGSDLAGLQCRAVRDGDEWIVNGQKVWNSGASRADRGLLLARTDPAVPKHLGITYFVIDMHQPGIETRPLRQMNGDAEFDEVFLTDARVGNDRIVAGLGEGWRVAQTTLAHERANIGGRRSAGATFAPGAANGLLDQRLGDLLAPPSRDGEPERARIGGGYLLPRSAALRLAANSGRSGDGALRQQLTDYVSRLEVNRLTTIRARDNSREGRPGAEASIGKLAMSNLARRSRDLAMPLLGAAGMLSGTDAPDGGAVQHMALSSFAAGLGGGTDEIQRNVLGERALGLPREPQPDRDVPFDRTPRV
ncbi:MAG: hypothetical protein JWL72_2932 [Ilumatobacteraceae bacterium]|nr:hypothetical protein [Ilumatobacteraceae bacterium]